MIDPADRLALEQCMAIAMQDAGRAQQLNSMLEDRPWEEVAVFAANCVQTKALQLKPWNSPPCVASADDPDERDKDAQKLLRKMLAAGVSRYHPNPMAALRRSGGHGDFAKI